jgi:hypothetical protein
MQWGPRGWPPTHEHPIGIDAHERFSGKEASRAGTSFLVDAYRWSPWFVRRIPDIGLASMQVEPRWAVFRKYAKNLRELARCAAPLTRTISLQSVSEFLVQQ